MAKIYSNVAKDEGLVFNSSKCCIKRVALPFFGIVIDAIGIRADPEKVEDIKLLEPPSSKEELQHFLGLATY